MRSIIAITLVTFLNKTANSQVKPSRFKTYTTQISDSLKAKNFGVQVSLLSDSVEFNFSHGRKNENEKITPGTTFNIGSTTKLITALLIIKAIEEGRLAFDDKLEKFFSGNKNVNPKITIRNLLQHTSGLRGGNDASVIYEAFMDSTSVSCQGNRYYEIQKTRFKPNSKYEYCNYNYILLGYILEKIYAEDYFTLFKRQLIDRYNLKNTKGFTVYNDSSLADPYIAGISYKDSTNNRYYKNVCYSAGSINSNSGDLCALLYNVFIKQTFITPKNISLIINSTVNIKGEKQYGFGIEKDYDKNGITCYGHGGDNLGYSCRPFINFEKKLVGVILYNTYAEWKFKEWTYRELMKITN